MKSVVMATSSNLSVSGKGILAKTMPFQEDQNCSILLIYASTGEIRWDEFYMSVTGTTADENRLGCHRRGRTGSSALLIIPITLRTLPRRSPGFSWCKRLPGEGRSESSKFLQE